MALSFVVTRGVFYYRGAGAEPWGGGCYPARRLLTAVAWVRIPAVGRLPIGRRVTQSAPRSSALAQWEASDWLPLIPSGQMTPGDRERYSRQILFPGIGEEGQSPRLDSPA